MTTTEPLTVARQLANLVGEDNARIAIEAGWRAIRELNSGHTSPLVHPGVADYVATASILAAVEAGLADTASDHLRAQVAELTAELAKVRTDRDEEAALAAQLRAEREHMELNPTGTAEWLKNRVAALADKLHKANAEIQRLTRDGIAYANENAELRKVAKAIDSLLAVTDGDPLGDRGIAISLGEIRRVVGEAREGVAR